MSAHSLRDNLAFRNAFNIVSDGNLPSAAY